MLSARTRWWLLSAAALSMALLTARLGLAAIDFCRPLPFIEARRPRFRDMAVEIGRGLTSSPPSDPDRPE